MNDQLIYVLECLAAGANAIRTDADGNYTTLEKEDGNEHSIESRLQYEVFGEYPLSECHKPTWDRIKRAFAISHITRYYNSPQFDGKRFWFISNWSGARCEFGTIHEARQAAKTDGTSRSVCIRDSEHSNFREYVSSEVVYP